MCMNCEQLPYVLRGCIRILDEFTGVEVLGVRGGDVLNQWRDTLGGYLHHQRRAFRDGVMLKLDGAARSVITLFRPLGLPPEVLADRIVGMEVGQVAISMFGDAPWLKAARFTMVYPLKDPRVMAVLHATQPLHERNLDGDTSVTPQDMLFAVRAALGGDDGWSIGGRLGQVLRESEGGQTQ
jgi:hypothetical protein